MAQEAVSDQDVTVQVENIGGIDESTVEFSPGITVLAGRNATNRTSLLQAIIAALGGDSATVKGNADQGHVELDIGGATYTRTLTRNGNTVSTSGNPYLEDSTVVELFGFLLETNGARQAVSRNDDLRDVIMEPVDTEEIESELKSLQSTRDRLDEQIKQIESLQQQLPDLEAEKTQLKETIADRKEELAEIKSRIKDAETDVDEKKEAQQEIETKIETLNKRRSKLEKVHHKVESQTESLDALRNERDELKSDLEEYEAVPDGRIDGINNEVQRLRRQKNRIESSIDELQTVIQFNSGLLDGDLDVFDDLHDGDEPVSTQLLNDSEEMVCWTCGSDIDTDQVEAMLDTLRELRNQKMDKRSDLDSQINELNDERIQLEEKQRQYDQITERLESVRDEIDDREARLDELQSRDETLEGEVAELEAEVEELQTESQQDSELLDHHKEANRLTVEIDRLEDDLENTVTEIDRIESRLSERGDLKSRRDDVQVEIEELRTRVDRLEQEAVEQFNEHMEQVLDILEYENLERIWIERTEANVRRGRQQTTEARFDLHVVRSTESGSVYEDVIDHLSESEREVTGLVFALAGYLVHEVYEQVPFMLLDSLEAIDAPRLAHLVNYFEEYADYLVVALLEEDAQALSADYDRITQI